MAADPSDVNTDKNKLIYITLKISSRFWIFPRGANIWTRTWGFVE